jgi:uncharacterized membrane protein YfcA
VTASLLASGDPFARGDPSIDAPDTDLLRHLLAALAALAGGAVNSIAGGGTLITFPALVALGIPPVTANATNTVALWPGALGSLWGYRGELRGLRRWALVFAVPSVLGGTAGALLLVLTPPSQFEKLAPWLVLGATALFQAQRPLARLRRGLQEGDTPRSGRAPLPLLGLQFTVAVYGGYFGAGIGILMLAALAQMGFSNIHQMNGLKNWGGLCINLTAAIAFATAGLVNWPLAASMAAAAIAGGYLGSRLALRVPQRWVRRAIVTIGVAASLWLLLRPR